MKKLIIILFAAVAMYATACGSNNADKTDSTDSIGNTSPTGPAPDNSNATNPSIPDTAFTDTANKMIDTTHK